MTVFLPGPFSGRSWAIPFPVGTPGADGRLRRAVENRTVLVTGATSGIGEATALKLGEAGARVLLVSRTQERLDEVAAEIREAGGEAFVHPADLADGDDADRLVAEVLDEHAHIDVLVNNAGRSIRRPVKRAMDRPHDYERTMALNYFGPLRLILGFLPAMRRRGRGQIVNVSSMGVQFNAPRFSAYVASKAALDQFTRVLAAEVEPRGIRCTTVHMPLVRTPMIKPTSTYDRLPTLTPEAAAEWVCEAIRARPRQVDLPLALVGELTDAVAPGLLRRAMSLVYRAGAS
jgi:NAD(P)-dependent dehydrogenase (short-subunit alcohol dehydrogenase family)